MGRPEMSFPLRHPRYVVEHIPFRHRVYRIQAWGHPWLKAARSVEELWLNLRYGNWKRITQALANRFRILTGRRRFH